jgi:hypothetical protein
MESAIGLILDEDFLLPKAAMLITRDIAIGTRPMAGNGLAVTTPEGIKRARAGTKATMVIIRRVRSGRRPLEVLGGLAMLVVCIWNRVSSGVLENREDKETDAMRRTDIEMTQTVPRSDLRLYTIPPIMAA